MKEGDEVVKSFKFRYFKYIDCIISTLFSSLVMTALILACLVLLKDAGYKNVSEGLRYLWKRIRREAKENHSFSKLAVLLFYSAMILFRTLFNRNMWANPVANVIGVWGLNKEVNGELIFTTEVPENMALFILFTVLLLWTYRDKILNKVTLSNVLWQSTKIVFLFSFTIEMLQLFLRLGTWQLSDLFFNTLGGFIGGLIYWIGYKVKHRGSGV